MYNLRLWIENKLHIWLNGAGLGTSFIAWATDNFALLVNLLLFSIPTFIYSALKFRQKYIYQERINELEIAKKEQELQQDKVEFDKKLNVNEPNSKL